MKNCSTLAILLSASFLAARPALAQQETGSALAISVYGGGAAFSDLQRRSVLYAQAGQDIRQFDQAVSAAPAVFGGIHLAYWPRENWGVRLTWSLTRSHFETYSLERGGTSDANDPSASPSRLTMSHLGADVVFRLPITIRRVRTYAVLGAGQTTYRTGDPDAAGALQTAPKQRSRLTGTIGAGAQIPLRENRLALEFELANYVAAAPWSADEVRDANDQTVRLEQRPGVPEVSLVNHARLSVGLRYALPLN